METSSGQRGLLATAVLSAGLGSATLFALEPFVGKVLLPHLGGTPSVWNTCMMVFQLLLLLGYGYSILLGRIRSVKRAATLHAALIAVAALITPFTMDLLWLPPAPGWSPALWISVVVMAAIGLPFGLLAATSPLLQLWLTRRANPLANVHRLYAVTNLANFAGLALYVGVLEPFVGARAQSWLLLATCLVGLVLSLRIARSSEPAAVPASDLPAAPAPSFAARVRWMALSFTASFALFAVSTHLATDIASFPLLFVVPLAVFLLANGLGYAAWAERHRPFVRGLSFLLPLLALIHLLDPLHMRSVLAFLLPLLALGALVTALALGLAEARPRDGRLPEYYALMGLGGVLAGVVCVLVLPWSWVSLFGKPLAAAGSPTSGALADGVSVFARSAVPEYPAAILLGLALISRGWLGRGLTAAGLTAALCAGYLQPNVSVNLYQTRNFYGTLRVREDTRYDNVMLLNGTTMHGQQPLNDSAPRPTSYFYDQSPVGQIIAAQRPRRVLVVGLGVGTLAAYAQPGDHYAFYELNPTVVELAERSPWFNYLRSARARGATVEVHTGDGRLLAAQDADARYDLIVLDAFSSDSIPVHLLTREALDGFAQHVAPDGAIAVHVSNRYFDLVPVLASTSSALGWQWMVQSHTARAQGTGQDSSTWVALTPSVQAKQRAGLTDKWRHPADLPHVTPWTDDLANPLGSLRAVIAVRWHGLSSLTRANAQAADSAP